MTTDPTNAPTPTDAPPAGWYPDPDGTGMRWWDGEGWTDHEQDAPPAMRCLACGNDTFDRTSYLLNTVGMTLLGWDGFNKTAACFVCRRCGFIHWYAVQPPTHR